MKRVILLLILLINTGVVSAQTVCNGNYCYDTTYGQNQQYNQNRTSYANPQSVQAKSSYSQITNDTRNTLYNLQSIEYTAQQAIFTAKNMFNRQY